MAQIRRYIARVRTVIVTLAAVIGVGAAAATSQAVAGGNVTEVTEQITTSAVGAQGNSYGFIAAAYIENAGTRTSAGTAPYLRSWWSSQGYLLTVADEQTFPIGGFYFVRVRIYGTSLPAGDHVQVQVTSAQSNQNCVVPYSIVESGGTVNVNVACVEQGGDANAFTQGWFYILITG